MKLHTQQFQIMDKIVLLSSIYLVIFSSQCILVKAQQRPKIVEHPADAIAAREEPLTLNCKATGRPTPEISWYHNGTPLVPSERRVILPEGSLFFLRVMHNKREQDAGIYWCEARSTAGIAVSKNATLQIAVLKDEFRSVPSDTLALSGGPVVLNCTPPRGVPEPSVLWYKDGKLLDLGKRISIIEEGSIMISEVQGSDAGRYECTAQNMAGMRSAPSVLLKVLTPPTVVRGPQDTEVIEGEGLDIPCEIKGDPKPNVQWYRDSGGHLPEGRSRILLDNTLRIEDAREEDQGQYTCKGFNEGGNVSISIRLSIYAPPTFAEAPTDAEVKVGDSIKLPCRSLGRPRPVIVWDKITSAEGAKLMENYSHMMEEKHQQNLLVKEKIMSFRPKRSIRLSENSTNRLQRSVLPTGDEVEEESKNAIFSELPNTTTNSGLGTTTSNTYSPHYHIAENGDLILKKAQKSDEGWYSCLAVNEAGSSSKKVYIHVRDESEIEGEFQIPEPPGSRWGTPQNLLITTITPISLNTLDVNWAVTTQPHLFNDQQITLYYRPLPFKDRNYSAILSTDFMYSVTNVDKRAHRLKDLKPFTVYEVFVSVPKGLGGSVSNLRKGKTLDGPPSAPPTDVRVGVINNTAAYVRWSPPPLELINGELTGYKIQIKSNITNKLLGQMSLNATTQSVVINSLSPGGRYIARVAPLTAGGLGPYSEPAALLMDPAFIARPPKTDPTTHTWRGTYMPGIILAIVGIGLISGAISAIVLAKRTKRNLKASYPTAPILTTTTLPDKSFNTLWMNENVSIKPTHLSSLPPIPSEYAEVGNVNFAPKLPQNPPPEPYATVTLQRNASGGVIGMQTEETINAKNKFLLQQQQQQQQQQQPNANDYNNGPPIRVPMNICDMLPPPPDHPYDSYHKPQINNMTIRTNPAALSPQILRKGGVLMPQQPPQAQSQTLQKQSPMQQQQQSQMWGTLPDIPPAPPIPNFPQNWLTQQRQIAAVNSYNTNNFDIASNRQLGNDIGINNGSNENNCYPAENDYESGSVLYEQFCRENDASYFTGNGEPTEQYYRNVNMEFFEDQEFEPATPPPPCPPDSSFSKGNGNSNLRLLTKTGSAVAGNQQDNFASQKRMFRNAAQHHGSRDSSCDRNTNRTVSSDDSESDVGNNGNDARWVTRSRRSRSRSKSNERRFREP